VAKSFLRKREVFVTWGLTPAIVPGIVIKVV
jgi:hypothetical protein